MSTNTRTSSETIIMPTSIYDHLKINIEKTSKGARVSVTYDRSDHEIDKAVDEAVDLYQKTIAELEKRGLQVEHQIKT